MLLASVGRNSAAHSAALRGHAYSLDAGLSPHALGDAVRRVRARSPFHIDAWVVLTDHMHCLGTLPQDDANFPGRWRAIKTGFAKSLPIGEPRSPVMTSRGERGIWQRRYWEHTIRFRRKRVVA
jgi:putative transposase